MKGIVIILVTVFCSLGSIAQEVKDNISFQYNSKRKIERIEFKKENIKGEKRTVDLVKDNPYNKLGFEEIPRENSIVKNFIVKDKKLNDIIPAEYRKNYNPDRKKLEDLPIKRAMTKCYVDKDEKNGLIISHSLMVYSNRALLGQLSTLEALDNDGNELLKFDNLDVNVTGSALTEDLNYIGICFEADDENGNLFPAGFRIYDVASKEIIKEKNFPSDYYNLSVRIQNGLIVFIVSKNHSKLEFHIYDMDNNSSYFKELTFDEISNYIGVSKEGFIFKNENTTITEPFKTLDK